MGSGLCVGVEADDPAGATFQSMLQAWAKPLAADDGVALLLINPDSNPHNFEVPLAAIPLTSSGTNLTNTAVAVRDIWGRADLKPIAKGTLSLVATVNGLDSAFYRLSDAALAQS